MNEETKKLKKPKGPVVFSRCTKEEKRRLRERARESKLSLSRYLVECGLRTQNPPDPAERALRETALYEIKKVGVNLNQVAHRLNQPSGIVSQSQIEGEMAALQDALEFVSDAFWQPAEVKVEES